jgi:hypothetical protein
MKSSLRLLVLPGIALLLTLGCGKRDPLDITINAHSPYSLLLWKGRFNDDLTPTQWHDFDEAVQELKLEVMTTGKATGAKAIQDMVFQKIDGRSVRSVVLAGFGFRLNRLLADQRDLQELIEHNRQLKTRKGDEDSAQYLAAIRSQQDERFQGLVQKIADAQAVLQRSGAAGKNDGSVSGDARDLFRS